MIGRIVLFEMEAGFSLSFHRLIKMSQRIFLKNSPIESARSFCDFMI